MNKGLAWSHPEFRGDMARLKCDWYYTWGCSLAMIADKTYVPMSREGLDPGLPADYDGFLLVFNEPNNIEPYGCELEPDEAAERYANLVSLLPSARMVVGGCYQAGIFWLRDFITALTVPVPIKWHAHLYGIGGLIGDSQVNMAHDEFGGTWWITEFGTCGGKAMDFREYVDYFKATSWIQRWAAYTNRQDMSEPWHICSGANLLDWDTGGYTPVGWEYRNS